MASVTRSPVTSLNPVEGRPAARRLKGGPMAELTGVQILSTGAFAPESEVPNEALAELGYDADWILQRTGIRSRRRAAPEEATSDIALEASRRCLERAGVSASELDLILVATMTPDCPTPSTACLVQRGLGSRAPAMDVNAACAGFMYGLVTGMQFVHTGACRRVLVVGADLMSRTVDPADRKTFPLFGDGAGAVLLAPGESGCGLLSYTLGADGQGADLLCMPAGGTREPMGPHNIDSGRRYLQMDGRAVFKWAVRLVEDAVRDVLDHAGLTPAEVDLFLFHQANQRILDAAADQLGLKPHQLFANLDRYGNTSAGSIPLALDEAVRADKIGPGSTVVLVGFGAGLAWGAGVLRW